MSIPLPRQGDNTGLITLLSANGLLMPVVQAFTKARIITEQPSNSNKADSDNDKREPGLLDAAITQLLNSDTDEKFDRFVGEE